MISDQSYSNSEEDSDLEVSNEPEDDVHKQFEKILNRLKYELIKRISSKELLSQEPPNISIKSTIQFRNKYLEWNKMLTKYRGNEFCDNIIQLQFLGEGTFGEVRRVFEKNSRNLYATKTPKKKADNSFLLEVEVMLHLIQSQYGKQLLQIAHIEQVSQESQQDQENLKQDGDDTKKSKSKKPPFLPRIYIEYGIGTLESYVKFRLKKQLFFEEAELLNITGLILSQLLMLFRIKVIHRDLKPENILVMYDGSLKLADFGISKKLQKEKFYLDYSGTPTYMAPEIKSMNKSKSYTQFNAFEAFACDLYSLGVSMQEIYQDNQQAIKQVTPEKCIPFKEIEKIVQIFVNEENPLQRVSGQIVSQFYGFNDSQKGVKYLYEFKNETRAKLLFSSEDYDQKISAIQALSDIDLGEEYLYQLDELIEELQSKQEQYPRQLIESLSIKLRSLILASKLEEANQIGSKLLALAEEQNLELLKGNQQNHLSEATRRELQLLMEVYRLIATLRQDEHKLDDSLIYFQKCVNICEQYGLIDDEYCSYLNGLGNILLIQKEQEKALEVYTKGYDLAKTKYKEEKGIIASLQMSIGLVYQEQGKLSEALHEFEEALETFKKLYGNSCSDVANCLNNMGNIYHQQNEMNLCRENFLQALRIKEQIYGEMNSDVALCCLNVSQTYDVQKSLTNGEKAREYAIRALETFQKIYKGDNHPSISDCYLNLADIEFSSFYLDKCLEYIAKGYKVAKDLLGEEHENTVYAKEEFLEKAKITGEVEKTFEKYGMEYEGQRLGKIEKQ